MIFRKLEQDVRRFKQAEEDLATALGLEDEDRERAGAMLVGRFEDGTPVTSQRGDGAEDPLMNNFTYGLLWKFDGQLDGQGLPTESVNGGDGQGAKCPFQAHSRKTNPRGSGGFQEPEDERLHLMARRGVTFSERTDIPFDDSVPPAGRPSGGVGLLFMAFNANISDQFDFTQNAWANNPGFPRVPPGTPSPPNVGLDPVIGQGPRHDQTYTPKWGGTEVKQVDAIAQAVRLKGGEYFFMPSLAFLRSL